MTASTTTDVLIAGGGPSGLVSALLLAKLGVRSIVIERNLAPGTHPKAHELNARSIEILRDAGISASELAAEASPLEDASRILFCRCINEEIGRIDLLADPARAQIYRENLRQSLPYLNLSQTELEKILVAKAQISPHIDLRFGHAWEGYEYIDGVVASAINGPTADRITSRYLLACDGAASAVRRALGIGMDGPAKIQTFVNAYFETNLRRRVQSPAKLYWILHPAYAGTFVAHHMDKRWVYATPVHEPWQQPEDFTIPVMRERILGALGFDVPDITIKSLSTWRMTAQIAQRYREGSIFLVGDAAHRFPPTGGLGMNTGIADAHNLAWKIAAALNDRAGSQILDTYQSERRPVALTNCAESRRNFEKIFEVVEALGLSRHGLGSLARLTANPVMKRAPAAVQRGIATLATAAPHGIVGRALRSGAVQDRVRAAIANQIDHFDRLGLDLGYIYGASPMEDGSPRKRAYEYAPSTEPGARLPHRWIETAEGRRSPHDALDYGRFTVFVPTEAYERFHNLNSAAIRVEATTHFPNDIFPSSEVLLVRPDGHVGWRGRIDTCNANDVLSAMNALLGMAPAPSTIGAESL